MSVTSTAPYRLNAALFAVALALAVTQLIAVPLLLLPHAPWIAAIVIALIALATPFHSALMHEAIHGRFAEDPRRNDRAGRTLAILSAVAFDAMRFGHMSHHRYNRHALDRPDVIEPGQSRFRSAINYYVGLFGGIYLREVGASFAMLLPRSLLDRMIVATLSKNEPEIAAMREAMRRGLDRRLWQMRFDVGLAIAIYATAFALYGAHWPLLMLGIALRGLIVSLMDNAPHYGTPAVVGADAINARTGRLGRWLLLNQNLHAVHHERPDLPWIELPGVLTSENRRCEMGYLTMLTRQVLGPWSPATSRASGDSAQTSVGHRVA
jgi:fatty acid desaturase